MRDRARAEYDVPAETTDLQLQQDLDRCQKSAEDASRDLNIASMSLMAAGVLVWPLIIVSIGTSVAAGAKANGAKSECMSTAGYVKK